MLNLSSKKYFSFDLCRKSFFLQESNYLVVNFIRIGIWIQEAMLILARVRLGVGKDVMIGKRMRGRIQHTTSIR